MKRKITSVLLALVLVLSFSLVTAVPAAAQVGSFTLGIGAYTGDPASTAEWSIVQKHSGNYAVHLYSGIKTGQGDEARIAIDPASVGITTLSDIGSISWWRYALAGYPAHLDITLDVNGNGVVDPEDVLTAEMAYNNPFWAPEVGGDKGPTLWEDGGHIADSYGVWFQTFETTAGDGFGAVNADTLLWVAKMGSGYGTAPSGTLAQWKAGTVGNDPGGEMATTNISGAAPVVKLEIEIDNWVFQAETYVDDVTINGVTYDLEPAGPEAVDLGTAANFAILTKTGITTTGTTSIVGDIGVSPITYAAITGFALTPVVPDGSNTFSISSLVAGKVYAADYTEPTPTNLGIAVLDMEAAYTDAAGRTPGVGATNLNVGGGTLTGLNFAPGTYTWNTPVTITGDITLTGTATDVWIFQISGTLNISSGKKVILGGEAQASNIFWAVAGVVSLGTTSEFNGNILAKTMIAMTDGATLTGRALAQTEVTLIANTITLPGYAAEETVELDETYYSTIQDAIDAASPGDTINVGAGMYNAATGETFPITVNKANLTIKSVSGAAMTIIDSGDAGKVIAISAAGVTIGGTGKGFTIMGKDAVANGVISIGANDATITENQFLGDYYLMVLGPGVSGAMVEDNIFLTYLAITANEVLGIYVNNDVTGSTFDGNHFPPGSDPTRCVDSGIYMATGTTADQTITISNNIFEGMGLRGGGTIGCGAIELAGVGGITIEDNTIVNCNDGIWFQGAALTGDVTIQNNTIIGNVWGIEVKDGVGTVGTITANYNNLAGSTTEHGLLNLETAVTIDARYNWWGAAAGPDDDGSKNPYHAQAAAAGASKVSTYVTFIPWLIHTDLASGWNVYSTPIASGTSTDTIAEALNLWGADSGNFVIAYYYGYDSEAETQAWASATTATALTPLQAIYIQMSAASTIDVISNTSYTAPPSQTAYAGWNLIGLAELYSMHAEDALASAYYVAGANNIGYSQVVSPGLGQTAWSAMRGSAIDTPTGKTMAPCEGYWVSMVNQGTLAGFTSTPITELP